MAAEAHVKMLALVHISSRYHVGKVLEEAREVFDHSSPPATSTRSRSRFPERGDPELDPERSPRDRARPEYGPSTEPPRQFVRARPFPDPPPPLLHCGRPLTRSREARKEAKK